MHLISALFFPRSGRRWLCIAALALAWLGVCRPAAAAISCSAASQGVVAIYTGAAITNATMLTPVSCTGLVVSNGNANQTNQYIMCTTSDAATSAGTGGSTVTPYRVARSAAGNALNYQFTTTSQFGSTPLTSAGVVLTSSNFSTYSSNAVQDQNGGSRTPAITVPASQSVPAGDYVSTVPITVDIRVANQSGDLTNCAQGTSAGMVVLYLPVTIRVGGVICAINSISNANFGEIVVSSGSVQSALTGAFVNVTCGSGTAWVATFSDGNNPSGTGTYRRRMRNGSSYLTYSLSAQFFMFGSPDQNSNTGTGSSQYFYVTLQMPNQTPTSLTQGVYSDTVIMSLAY